MCVCVRRVDWNGVSAVAETPGGVEAKRSAFRWPNTPYNKLDEQTDSHQSSTNSTTARIQASLVRKRVVKRWILQWEFVTYPARIGNNAWTELLHSTPQRHSTMNILYHASLDSGMVTVRWRSRPIQSGTVLCLTRRQRRGSSFPDKRSFSRVWPAPFPPYRCSPAQSFSSRSLSPFPGRVCPRGRDVCMGLLMLLA
ncbi:uncharacterized protein K489DRAFT_162506 [Dissoconium aciculare CBS 342.82]|uniref:Uncharacterized protein n=1 Tax=Dissoconium aciculare CBS 342.82 TaxID=1314786 RepID=A0A6J3MDC2_9PEZI|nr:uncharacterized protein K489DRAFT_162506 [Dissoconium aciculare CBS 342.82]KAF1825594.1 hypothetical protein K489DRAFT_162506 [Dissoconium aciculare CBS 342.82]